MSCDSKENGTEIFESREQKSGFYFQNAHYGGYALVNFTIGSFLEYETIFFPLSHAGRFKFSGHRRRNQKA